MSVHQWSITRNAHFYGCCFLIASFCIGFFATEGYSQDKPDRTDGWCAKYETERSTDEESKFQLLLKNTNILKMTGTIWPTKTIPYVVDPILSGNARTLERIKNSAIEIRKLTGVNLVSCKFEAIKSVPEISGFIVFTDTETVDCPRGSDGARRCCTSPASYKPRTHSILIGNVVFAHKEFGVQVGVDTCQIGSTMHEVMHALGLQHQQEHPDASNYIDSIKPEDSNGCRPSANDTWTSQYDPASIMHYRIGTKECDLQLKCTKRNGPPGDDLSCEVDRVLASKTLCGYRTSTSNACVTRTGKLLKPNGNRGCLSVFDQVWLIEAYKDKESDKFGLQSLIDDGRCSVP
jgi:hypothetical protein